MRFIICIGLLCFAHQQTAAVPEVAQRSDAFVESMGIGIKPPSWGNYTLVYANTVLIKSKLADLGMRYVRYGSKDVDGDWNFGRDLSTQLGIRSNINISWYYANLGARLQANADWIVSVEGANETNSPTQTSWTYKGQGFPSGTIALQNDIYTLMKSAPATSGIPIITPSVYFTSIAPESQLVGCLGDYENMHSYAAGGQPTKLLDTHIDHANQVFEPDRPIIVTETGYHTALQATGSVTEKAQSKYMPRIFAEYWNRHIRRTYIYDLIDLGTDQSDPEATYGILHNDGMPKPAFTALKTLIALLKEPGVSFAPGSLDYSLSGNLTKIRRLLLQKSNGDYYLLIWQDVSVFDGGTRADIVNADVPVSCSLATSVAEGTIYRFTDTGNLVSTPASFTGNTLSLNVPDSVMIIKLTPGFKALAGDGKVVLQWMATPGATRYNIRRSTSASGPYSELVTSLSDTSFTDGTVVNGTTYYYIFSAVGPETEGLYSPPASASPQPVEFIMDTADPGGVLFTGTWASGTGISGYYGTDYRFFFAGAGAAASVKFTPPMSVPGIYDVYARWTAHANRSTAAPFVITHAQGTDTVTMNQQLNNGTWIRLGSFPFNAGTGGNVTLKANTTATGYVVADAMRFVLQRRTEATLSSSNLIVAYDGNPKSIPVVTSPANLNVFATYNGAATLPTGPGIYTVNTTINDPFLSGFTTSQLTITVPDVLVYAIGSKASRLEQAESGWTFVFDRLRTELIYTVQLSSDLETWSDFATNPGEIGKEVRLTIPFFSEDLSRSFARLRVTLPGTQ